MKLFRFKMASGLFLMTILLAGASGCEALGRKFVRKPKPEDQKKEEVIFAPEEYKSEAVPNQELYRQYFLYWMTWQDELIDSLEKSGNRKKQAQAINEAVKNLENILPLVKEEAAARLALEIKKLELLRTAINRDIYENSVEDNRKLAENLKQEIRRGFSFKNIKDQIK
jgi:hypothetical protein